MNKTTPPDDKRKAEQPPPRGKGADAYDGGLRHFARGDYDKAIAEFTEALRLDPNLGLAYAYRGSAYVNQGAYKQALADYSEVIRLFPTYPVGYYSRSIAYRRLGEYDKSLADCTEAIRLDPKYAEAYENRGLNHSSKGNVDKAVSDFSEAIRLKPTWAAAYENRGLAFADKGDYKRAIADLDEAIRLDSKYADAYNNRGWAYLQKGEAHRALPDFNQSIQLAPQNAKAFANRATAYRALGDPAKAADDERRTNELSAQPAPPVSGVLGQKPGPAQEITNSIGMKLVYIPAGSFRMGAPDDDRDAYDDQKPQHQVEITQPFYLGKHEVTVGQFRRFVDDAGYRTDAEKDGKGGSGYDQGKREFLGPVGKYTWRDPGFDQTDAHAVVNVSWNDAVAFCAWLSKKEGQKYRLATEAEWEYACRARTTTRYHSGDGEAGLERFANIADKSLKAKWNYAALENEAIRKRFAGWFERVSWDDGYPFTAPVGKFQPNAFGLHDMHGNVWEWCADWHGERYYKESPRQDPQGPAAGSTRVLRGGSYFYWPGECTSAIRSDFDPAYRGCDIGFRVVRAP